ncbi:MAG: type II toxin-antitoxin system VapC family toxin [Anaerolineales bacterium]|nr:type II toxin-antitoxin system VapC family toxin [Anaerolineales bacterium]
MSQFITDTHPLIWHLTKNPELSLDAQTIFANTDSGSSQILLPGIVLVEIVYLAEKGVIPTLLVNQLLDFLEIPNGSYAIAPLDPSVIRIMAQQVPWSAIPEMADRIITATALALNLSLITRDQRIQQSKLVSVLW